MTSRGAEPGRAWAWLGPPAAWAHGEEAGPKVIRLVHASRFAVVDRQGRIRRYVDGTDSDVIEQLTQAVRQVVGEP